MAAAMVLLFGIVQGLKMIFDNEEPMDRRLNPPQRMWMERFIVIFSSC